MLLSDIMRHFSRVLLKCSSREIILAVTDCFIQHKQAQIIAAPKVTREGNIYTSLYFPALLFYSALCLPVGLGINLQDILTIPISLHRLLPEY